MERGLTTTTGRPAGTVAGAANESAGPVTRARLGPLSIALEGGGPSFDVTARELGAAAEAAEEAADLVIRFVPEVERRRRPDTIYSAKDHLLFDADGFFRDKPIPYQMDGLFHGERPAVLTVRSRPARRGRWLRNLLRGALGIVPLDAAVTSYTLLWYILHVMLLRFDAAFLHAAVLQSGSSAIAFTGTGGAGKTGLVFNLLEASETRFLAEDFGIVDATGQAFVSPKRVSVYASDTVSSALLRRRVRQHLDAGARLRWEVATRAFGRNPIVKVSPEELLPGQVGDRAPLKRVLFLVRSEADEPRAQPISAGEMAQRAASASMRELRNLTEITRMIDANDLRDRPTGPLEPWVAERTSSVYQRAFSRTENLVIQVPRLMQGGRVAEWLRAEGIVDL